MILFCLTVDAFFAVPMCDSPSFLLAVPLYFVCVCVCACFLMSVLHPFLLPSSSISFVFPGVLVCIQMVCAPCFASVCLNLVHGEMKQASDLVGAVNQSYIKAPVFQPIDDQGSGPEFHRRRSQFSFPRSEVYVAFQQLW